MIRICIISSKTGFPRDKDLVATIRPLDDYSNTYIGIHVVDRMLGSEKYKYADSRSKLYYSWYLVQ